MVFIKHYAPNLNVTYTELVCNQIYNLKGWQDFIHILTKGRDSEKGHNPDEKKNVSPIFS